MFQLSASDDDEGGAGEVRYSIASPVLTVDPYSGWVSVVSDVPVSAMSASDDDEGGAGEVRYSIASPVLTVDPYCGWVSVVSDVPVSAMSASDDDEGGAGEVRYSIASPVLTVDPYSGWVSVVSALDREVEPIHSAVLTATDNGDPALSSTAVLLLDIVDYNDSPPTFSERLYTVSVNESLPVGSSVLQVVASDPDGAGLDYYITSGDPHYRFSLRSTGQLSLAQPLDRELVDSYTLNISVSDSKYVVHTTVIIHVFDVNDNQPHCLQPMLKTTVSEDAAPGSTVLTVLAEDADLNPQLRYHLTGTNAAHFYFNQITGELKTGVSLDRETVSEYSLVAHVLDRDTSGWECTSHVTIHVADVNDNAPVFSSSNYTAAVPVDYPPGSFVTILRAVDTDFGMNRRVRYSMDSEYFTIDAASGLVQVAKPLDKTRYSLVVVATDLGDPPLSTAANLHVLVVDVNDNPPEFSSRSHQALVSEDAEVGTEVTRLSAISVDDGVRSPVVYSIIAGNEFGKFTIEPSSDKIIVAELLDYEETRQYLLTVLATDAGEHPLSTHTAVNITVSDSNDNAPIFSQPSYSAEISELATPGDNVIQVTAVDADSGASGLVRYTLVGERSKEFKVDSVSGTIKLAMPLDREKVDSYVLRVQARDSGSPTLSSIAVVHVSVTDANDNPPLFLQPNLTAILQEDKPAGWAVCQLVVTDADVFHNAAPFIFEILYDDSGGKFRIDSKGVLQTLTQFSRQSKDTYHLQVRVYDGGSPPLYSDSWITIKVIEESQFPPDVSPLRVTVVSYEDRWLGGDLGQVLASDRDHYDSLGYELLPTSSLFTIDPQHGVIEASSGLDVGRYLLNVSVTDGKFSRQVTVEVVVLPLWEENLQHAVSLRLVGISPERFLAEESWNLIKTMESVTLRNASIGSIQKTSSKYLDVLLIIMGGLDLSTAAEVLRSLGLSSTQPSCSCKNAAKCRQRVTVFPDQQLKVRTNTSVYISPAHSFTLYCACALGFTGDLCEEQLPAMSECACSGSQTCLNPPCVAPSCANNHSCFPPNIASGASVFSQELLAITATTVGVVIIVALFVVYRRCHGDPRQAKHRRTLNKQPGAVDKLDITEISGTYCQHDILAGISLNSLPRASDQTQNTLDVIAEETTVVTTSLQREDDVESYGFPSRRHPTLPDIQTFQVS
ncbi:fat-like cadherin-related tumor suppressor homolog [Macrosteles quadrilineatus]|uniref:fat-like cadherin-related tumor suppressor homolog n=1 Tax=Macrosteles quadrilineatus TaxID=74068 RepID=UPI0023E34D22|nr:fat-like cadherin-related tumor suppressor homolog [Macrosteles quadrilineatus]